MAKKGLRSSPYPSYTIDYCLDLVTKIYTNFGSGNYYAKREEIAKVLGISAAHLQTQVSSATQYGLLELKQSEGYKPSDLFRQIFKPLDENSKKNALTKVFQSPHLYEALIAKFGNEILPALTPLTNILIHHHNISDAAAEKAASIFIDNAKNLGFLNNENILSFSERVRGNKENVFENEDYVDDENTSVEVVDTNYYPVKSPNKDDVNTFTTSQNIESKPIPFNIPLKGNRTAQIIVPYDVKSTDFDFIINFINLMKQQFE